MNEKKMEAKKMYEEGYPFKHISAVLEISINTIKSWKRRNNWERNELNLKTIPSSRGAPRNNKNAIKTGEYETIFFDYLSEEEKKIYSNLSNDPHFVMSEEIRLLRIRQRRMMKRIVDAEAGLTEKEQEKLFEIRDRKAMMRKKELDRANNQSIPDLILTEMKEHSFRKITDILSIEDALTRVSAQLQRAVKQLDDLAVNEKRLNLIDAQIDRTKAQTSRSLHNKEKYNAEGGNVINIIDDLR